MYLACRDVSGPCLLDLPYVMTNGRLGHSVRRTFNTATSESCDEAHSFRGHECTTVA